MKIFQLIDLIIKLFKLNKRSKVVLLFLLPTFLLGQNNGAFWLGKRPSGAGPGLPIITENLIAYYDASNTDSYPGIGTTWFDLSGNDYDLTISGATYLSDNGGIFDFDGNNDYAFIQNSFVENFTTISLWFLSDIDFVDLNASDYLVSFAKTTSDFTGVRIGSTTSSFTGETITFQSFDPISGLSITSIGGVNNTWYNITGVWDGSKYKLFINGTPVTTTVLGTPSLFQSIQYIRIGTRIDFDATRFLNGKIGEIYFYSDALSDAEVLSNFNATKTRFGL